MTSSEKQELQQGIQSALQKLDAGRVANFWEEELPALTKVYQCPLEIEDVFLLLTMFPGRWKRSDLTNETKEHLLDTAIKELEAVCRLAQSIMRTVYEEQGVTPQALRELNDWLPSPSHLTYIPGSFRHISSPTRIFLAGKEGEIDEILASLWSKQTAITAKGLVAVSGIVEQTQASEEVPPAVVIARELKRILLEDSYLLRKCEECEAIYERNRIRPQQRFCSFRCSDRNGHRRRKNKKTSGDPVE